MIIKIMTFIISKIVDGKIINYSDSMISELDILTRKYQPNENSFSSILKTIIISMDVCISYAGNVWYADKCLKEILNLSQRGNFLELVNILKRYSVESNETTIFGIAIINKDEEILQAKISGNNFQDCTNSLMWLGDSRAYDIFNKEYKKILLSKPETESLQLAFESVINNKQIDGVGHFDILTSSTDRKMKFTSTSGEVSNITRKVFEYAIKIISKLTTPITISIKEKNRYEDIPVNMNAGEIQGISYFTSFSSDKFGVAIYNLQEKKGLLLCPQLKLESELYTIVSGNTISSTYQNFIDEIYKKHKLPMRGFVWLPDTMGFQFIANF